MRRSAFGLLAITLVAAACGAPEPRWNVLLVTFDTTRADHLGAYGYQAARTPTIDSLATEGVLFSRTYTTNPITLPAHTSLMTGTYPVFHGVRNNSTYFVRDELTTLAERLQAAGYSTAAFVGAFVLDSRFNLDQGFEHYDDQVERDWSRDEIAARERDAFGFAERKANLVSLAAIRWLRERRERKPFFVWLHYFDPHEPKNPPEPHRSLSPDPYDAEIAFADEQLGNVLDELRRENQYERTLVVFTADHGEGLLDHGEPTHALLIYDSTIHVPLIFRIPGGEGGRRDDQLASLVDVLPSVLDLLDLEPGGEEQGISLFLPPGRRPQRRSIYMESMVGKLQHGWSSLRGLRDDTHKLIYGSAPRLFRVDEDPGEVFNLAGKEPEVLADLEQRLAAWLDVHRSPEATDAVTTADQEAIRKLQSLGYVVSLGSHGGRTDETLENEGADPHELRYLFDLFGVALEDIRQDRVLQGIAELEEVLQVDPDNLGALNYLATTYYQQTGQVTKARKLLERSLELDSEQEEAHYHLCRILVAAGDLEGARAHAEAILGFQPNSVAALYELGRIAEAEGDEPGALAHYQAALDRDPSYLQSLLALGVLHARQKRHGDAGVFFERAVEVEPDNPEVLYNLAIWQLQGEERGAAMDTLSRAIAVDPQDADAQYVLGRLLAESGQRERARAVLQRALELNAERADRVARIQGYLEQVQ